MRNRPDPLPGVGAISGRVARDSTYRKTACGPAFRFAWTSLPCKAADPRILVPAILRPAFPQRRRQAAHSSRSAAAPSPVLPQSTSRSAEYRCTAGFRSSQCRLWVIGVTRESGRRASRQACPTPPRARLSHEEPEAGNLHLRVCIPTRRASSTSATPSRSARRVHGVFNRLPLSHRAKTACRCRYCLGDRQAPPGHG